MKKTINIILIVLFVFSGCNTQNGTLKKEPLELKIMNCSGYQIDQLINFILYKKYNVEMIENENYLMIKNINEEILFGIHGMLHLKLDIINKNIANTTNIINGEPYRRQYLIITIENGIEIIEDMETPFYYSYDPLHQDSIKDGEREGYVLMPNIDLVTELNNMLEISHLYNGIYEFSINHFKDITW
jgi:flagellar basal-body rod protein FlgC